MTTAQYTQFWRMKKEASFNASTPGAGAEWNLQYVSNVLDDRWYDLPAIQDNNGLQPMWAKNFPLIASGKRAMNPADPLTGAEMGDLGALDFVAYPELCFLPLLALYGAVSSTETAGTATMTAATFDGMSGNALTAAPTGDEVFKFTIAAATGAGTGAAILILVDGAEVERISIPDSIASPNGDYIAKGGWGGTGTVTISTAGTIPSATLAISSAIQYTEKVFYPGENLFSYVIGQGGRPESGDTKNNSEFHPGIVLPTSTWTFDRDALDGVLAFNTPVLGINPTAAASQPYQDDVAKFYKPVMSWNGRMIVNDTDVCELKSMNLSINPNNELNNIACGNQQPTDFILGQFESFGTLVIVPQDDSWWTAFRDDTPNKVQIEFNSKRFLNASTPWMIRFTWDRMFIETYGRTRVNQVLTADVGVRGVNTQISEGSLSQLTAPSTVTVRSRLPGVTAT